MHLCLFSSPSLLLSQVLPTWALECTYLSSVVRQRGRKTFFLPLNCIDSSRRKALGSKCLSEDIPNAVCLCISVFQVWSFPCQGEWDWHKENNECNFFSPCYCSLHCFFFLFVWVYLKENLFCNDCLQFKSINPKFFQETDSGAGFTCKNWGAGFRQPHKCRCLPSLWSAHSVPRHPSMVPHWFSESALQMLGSRAVAANTWLWPTPVASNLLCLLRSAWVTQSVPDKFFLMSMA